MAGSVNRGLLFGFAAAVLWGTHSVVVQRLTQDMGGIQISVLRLYIALASMFVILRIIKQPIQLAWGDRNFWMASGATVVNYILFHIGLERADAASAMILENTAPFFVLILLFVLFGTPVTRREVFATCIAIVGVALTVVQDLDSDSFRLFGDLLEIGAGLAWAFFLIGSSRAMQASKTTGERVNFMFGVFLVASVVMTPLLAFDFVVPKAGDIPLLAFLGVVATAVLYYLWAEAAARVSTLTASLLFALSVAFTFVNAAIFLDEPVTPLAVLGATLIVVAVLITAKPKPANQP